MDPVILVCFLLASNAVARNCNRTEAIELSRIFVDKYITGCPSESWLLRLAADDSYKPERVFVNVGFNKGYNFALWLDAFAPAKNVNGPRWHSKILSWNKEPNHIPLTLLEQCGFCKDCRTVLSGTLGRLATATAINKTDFIFLGVELGKTNFDLVKWIGEQVISEDMDKSIGFYLTWAGLSNAPGTMRLPKCVAGREICRLEEAGSTEGLTDEQYKAKYHVEVEHVTITTLDEVFRNFTRTHGHAHPSFKALTASRHANSSSTFGGLIDILLIDTEGNDALVLQGAIHLIRSRAVRCLIFEYHEIPPWPHMKLEDSVRILDSHGYECFFLGHETLWRITGTCWTPLFEFHKFSNVMCMQRTDRWMQTIQGYVVTLENIARNTPV